MRYRSCLTIEIVGIQGLEGSILGAVEAYCFHNRSLDYSRLHSRMTHSEWSLAHYPIEGMSVAGSDSEEDWLE